MKKKNLKEGILSRRPLNCELLFFKYINLNNIAKKSNTFNFEFFKNSNLMNFFSVLENEK